MTLALPASIASFFRVSNGDTEPLSSCFAADAVVHDENHVYQGYSSIQSWLEQARQKYLYKAEPVSYEKAARQFGWWRLTQEHSPEARQISLMSFA